MRNKSFFILLTLIFCTGWTSRTHQMIVVEASKLTPYELKLLINHYKEEVLEGAIQPLRGAKDEKHFLLVDGSYGKAHFQVEAEIKYITTGLKEHKLELGDFCRRLGVISHYIAEVNNPILTGDLNKEGGWFYNHFVQYTESKLPTFILTFDGYKNDLLEKKDFQGFVISLAIRSSAMFEPLKTVYVNNRIGNAGFDFDEKSIPYAAASLSYNHSITDTARIWYYIWKLVHGDMSYAPYDTSQTEKKKDVS